MDLALGGEVLAEVAIVDIGGEEGAGPIVDHDQGLAVDPLLLEMIHALDEDTGGLMGLATDTVTLAIFGFGSHFSISRDLMGLRVEAKRSPPHIPLWHAASVETTAYWVNAGGQLECSHEYAG